MNWLGKNECNFQQIMEKVCYFVFMFKCQTPGVLFQCDLYVREIILLALLER